ncbi:MICAL protein 2 [Echinococcus multilocularis]|uniref:MICAL protein 2 n=1 Tax=Echinococcus multilocularis TaxID=6211 RepID=A0A068Y3W3_ECHMU|nr:MICAL protein 2 [Echinococcus multilocularis]
MTPDKMHVANWLRSLPTSGDFGTGYRPPSRLEVSKASLVLNLPSSHPPQTALPHPPPSPSSFEKADTAEDELPSFQSSEAQMLFPPLTSPVPTPPNHNHPSTNNLANRLSTRHLQQQISQMKREASSISRLNALNRGRLFGSPSPTPAGPLGTLAPHPVEREVASPRAGISTSTSFNTSLHEQQQQQQQQQQSVIPQTGTRDFKRRAHLCQSVYLSSGEPVHQSQHRFGRPLGEQRSSRFAKSADFQSSNLAFEADQQAFHSGELKKHGSNSLLQWLKQGVRKLRNSIRRSLSREDWPAQSMPSFPMFYQNTTTANSVTPTMGEHKRQPSWSSRTHKSRSRAGTARGSSGDVYPLHSALPHVEYDRGSSISNLRRCLSLAENQNREIGSGAGNVGPFSMEVIPETELQTSSQNLGPSSYLRRDSTMEQILAWQQGAASMLSLNATPNGVSGADRSSQSGSRHIFHAPPFPEPTELRSSEATFFDTRNEPLPNNNYMARSGRDSGFIDIPSHQNFAQMDSSAYSVIHLRQPSEPRTQETSDVKEITDAFEGLASDALKGSSPLVSTSPFQMPTPSQQIHGMAEIGVANWWTEGFAATHQNQQEQQQQRQISVNNGADGGGDCQDWNVYQNGFFASTSGDLYEKLETVFAMTTESPGLRRPPPRPPKSQYLLNREIEVLAARQAAFRLSSVPYPKEKNPFGESSGEESDTSDTDSSPPPKTAKNPFAECESDNEEPDSRSEEKLATYGVKEIESPIKLAEVNKVSSSNPFDVITDPAEEGAADMGSHESSPPSHPSQNASKTVGGRRNSEESPVLPRLPRKRLAPKPPRLQSNSMEVLVTDTATASTCMLPSSALRLSLRGMNEIAVRSSPTTCRKNSTSCEIVHTKGPAPPLPVAERREIRAEGFVKYPKLRREIEEANVRLSQYDGEIEVCEAKLKSVGDDSVKSKKYTKKLAKLKGKRQSVANKQKELSNRLQEQVLEDRHADLEYELRGILAKQEHLRTAKEQERADELLQLLLEIVQERGKLVEERASPERNQPPVPSPESLSEGLNVDGPSADVIRSDWIEPTKSYTRRVK